MFPPPLRYLKRERHVALGSRAEGVNVQALGAGEVDNEEVDVVGCSCYGGEMCRVRHTHDYGRDGAAAVSVEREGRYLVHGDGRHRSRGETTVVFNVSCETTPAMYCMVDLSAGANATSYPVTYLASPPSGGFNVDAYKTTKLVLRRIESGSFVMCGQYDVTLTKP